MVQAEQMEELENLRKQHELLKKMLEQQHQLRALQGRQEALMAMQESAEQAIAAIEDTGKTWMQVWKACSSITMSAFKQSAQLKVGLIPLSSSVVTETTGSVSGLSITSELNEELNDLIQRFHNQLHDSRVQ